MPCSLVRGYLHWGGTGCLQFSPKYESSCTRLHGSITLKTIIWIGLTIADLNKAVFFRATTWLSTFPHTLYLNLFIFIGMILAFNNSTYIVSKPFHSLCYGFGYCIFKTASSALFIIQCLFCLNFSLLCCVQLMLNFIYFMIHMLKAQALLYHKTGEMCKSPEVYVWE